MTRAALILLALTISGCQTRYVKIACLTPEQVKEQRKAEPPKVAGELTGKADQDIRPIAGSAVRLRSWGKGMLGILEGCAG